MSLFFLNQFLFCRRRAPAIILVQFGVISPNLVDGHAIAWILPVFFTLGDDCLDFQPATSDNWARDRLSPKVIHN